ncbi:MAG: DUF4013 domain-containing protein [Methanobrevibacter sp.]|jgi:hypothetical protein|nr:DUF4013 domain-containing protein [Candidatus Methanoflexus mossambicus]
MDITKLFKDALNYPTTNWKRLLILGVFLVLVGLSEIVDSLNGTINSFGVITIGEFIFFIFIIVFGLISMGYLLSIIKETISNPENPMPNFDLIGNMVSGVSVFIVIIIYLIIPALITFVLALVTNSFSVLSSLFNTTTGSYIGDPAISGASLSFAVVLIIGLMLFIISCLLMFIAISILAETGSIAKAINFPLVFKKIGEIGWANYIIFLIIYLILSGVIIFISRLVIGVFMTIGFFMGSFSLFVTTIGVIISTLLIESFLNIFNSRAAGLIYNESKKE